MTVNVIPLPASGRWAEDLRGDGRAVRVSAHPDERLLTLSLWKNEACVASVQLQPSDVAGLVSGLTECLVRLTGAGSAEDGSVEL
jgi:hypothetical protein